MAGRVVVVTGGAGGIGRAVAARFAEAGARIALMDVDAERLEQAAEALRSKGTAVLALTFDIRDPQACEEAVGTVRRQFGQLDVLVNNAGMSHRSLFSETRPDVIRRVMEVNFFGAVHVTRAALDDLTAARGQIVVLSSVAGFAPLVGRTGYAASKHALHGFFESLRTEVAPKGVGVTMVCPAFTRTGLEGRALGGDGATLGPSTRATAGTVLTPEAVAEAVFQATGARKRLALLSPVARLSYWVARLLPGLYDRLMLRSQGEEFPTPKAGPRARPPEAAPSGPG